MTKRHERIAQRAYTLWEEAGRPDGRDAEHWAAAEAELEESSPGGEDGTETGDTPSEPVAMEEAAASPAPARETLRGKRRA